MKRVNVVRGVTTAACLVGLVLASAGTVSASEGDDRGELVDAVETPISPAEPTDDFEALALPPIPLEVAEYTEALQTDLANDPRFNVVEISADRTEVTVWWHGDESEQLSELVESAPGELVSTTIAQTVYLPGDLKATAQKIMSEGAELGVVSVSTPKDGSSLKVAVSSQQSKRSADELASIEKVTGIPVVIEESPGIVPANTRQNDKSYHLGGASIHSYWAGSGCTSGFSVQKGSEQGSMFAAHCGGVGEYWVTYDSFWDPSWYNYGTTDQRITAYDGAIMKSNFSQAYMWTQGPTSTVAAAIKGQYTAPVGAEICYSGSQSGVVCGNIVQERNYPYSLGGDLSNVTGLVTVQSSGQPAAGNGDSGGPGYVILNIGGSAARYASTIISAIPANSGTNCTGNPGGGGRYCSATVISTDVAAIAAASGWSIQVAP